MRRTGCFLLVVTGWLILVVAPLPAQTVLVKPYVQPGNGSTLGKTDVKVLCWFTDQKPGEFEVEYGPVDGRTCKVKPERSQLDFAKPPEPEKRADGKPSTAVEREQHYFKYVARLNDLPPNADIRYRVTLGAAVVRESHFRTRVTPDRSVRMALVGDIATGGKGQKAIAFYMAQQNPDFMLALGDIVYPSGRVSQYMKHFWPIYNDVESPDPTRGAPLAASVPVYAVNGNHDVAARFPAIPDALGLFYFFHTPENGPGEGPWVTSLGSDKASAARFRESVGSVYPALDAYSFDYGPAHILVLNSNLPKGHEHPAWCEWVERDLKRTTARWKLVCFHCPTFQSSTHHYTEQTVRLWVPLFEKCGVDVVFAGHVHNYQRSVPLTFTPTSSKRDKKGRVDGAFVLDTRFDGRQNASPKGIIHIVAGGGGGGLYGPELAKTVSLLKQEHGANYADYTAKMMVERHSFVVVDVAPEKFRFRAIDSDGKVFDQFQIAKPIR